MTGTQVALLVGVFLVSDVIVVGAIFHALSETMRETCGKYPAVEPMANAVRRRYQSFKFGMVSLGGCVHVAVDERYLHLTPARVARWLGMRAMSVPWEAIEVKGRAGVGSSLRVKIGKEEVLGPEWCLSLAGKV